MELEFTQEGVASWFERAHRAKPFMKWAGGKQLWVLQYGHLLPDFAGTYIEPFLGGGSVFFHLSRTQRRPFQARLGDTNRHLIRAFIDVRDHADQVADKLEILQAGYDAASDKADFYYDLRDSFNSLGPKADSGTFIFLIRSCWNGLYRVNKEGRFNVPFGAPKSANIAPKRDDILNASAALTNVRLRATSWKHTLSLAEPGDFVFLDPPYFSDTFQRADSKYQKQWFGLKEHEQLADRLIDLVSRDVDFILTNSAEPQMLDLYRSRGFDVNTVAQPRSINSKTDQRGGIDELLVTPASRSSDSVDLTSRIPILLELEAQRNRVAQMRLMQGDEEEG
jgi:DNA adenine methylase